ncbi:nucleotidyltransferase domain-containing protein [Candidatus Pacearchaeota archaeon]|nr:nucleotidyltransferase domain-containing protein [Candidatus Pacearchaeota archaeon]
MGRETIKLVKEFIRKASKDFKISRVILFGSRAGKDYLEYSDVDIVVVSPDFSGVDFSDRMRKMYDYWESEIAVDFFCYTPEEFVKFSKMITLVSEAVRTGIVIK